MANIQTYRSSNSPQARGGAELAFINGKIYTVDPRQPWVEAVAIKNGRFTAVGSRSEVEQQIDQETEVVDLQGQFAMPGIYDMHTHPDLALAPDYAGYLNIGKETPTPEEVKQAILTYAAQHPGEGWIYGQYWVRFAFRQAGITAGKAWLDSFMPHRPVAILDRQWGTMMVNSKALELAGISAETPDPRNGYLERDGLTDEPTGLMIDGAYAMIHAAMPPTPVPAR